jgi:hypothetical protein
MIARPRPNTQAGERVTAGEEASRGAEPAGAKPEGNSEVRADPPPITAEPRDCTPTWERNFPFII